MDESSACAEENLDLGGGLGFGFALDFLACAPTTATFEVSSSAWVCAVEAWGASGVAACELECEWEWEFEVSGTSG